MRLRASRDEIGGYKKARNLSRKSGRKRERKLFHVRQHGTSGSLRACFAFHHRLTRFPGPVPGAGGGRGFVRQAPERSPGKIYRAAYHPGRRRAGSALGTQGKLVSLNL